LDSKPLLHLREATNLFKPRAILALVRLGILGGQELFAPAKAKRDPVGTLVGLTPGISRAILRMGGLNCPAHAFVRLADDTTASKWGIDPRGMGLLISLRFSDAWPFVGMPHWLQEAATFNFQ
jgi:hypothetical protein